MFKYVLMLAFVCKMQSFAQSKTCDCRTIDGVYTLVVDGTFTYKGKTKTGGYQYAVNLSFENLNKCLIKLENINVGKTDLKPVLSFKGNAKNIKYKKNVILKSKIEPEVGLDDLHFADLKVTYKALNETCKHNVTVGLIQK